MQISSRRIAGKVLAHISLFCSYAMHACPLPPCMYGSIGLFLLYNSGVSLFWPDLFFQLHCVVLCLRAGNTSQRKTFFTKGNSFLSFGQIYVQQLLRFSSSEGFILFAAHLQASLGLDWIHCAAAQLVRLQAGYEKIFMPLGQMNCVQSKTAQVLCRSAIYLCCCLTSNLML